LMCLSLSVWILFDSGFGMRKQQRISRICSSAGSKAYVPQARKACHHTTLRHICTSHPQSEPVGCKMGEGQLALAGKQLRRASLWHATRCKHLARWDILDFRWSCDTMWYLEYELDAVFPFALPKIVGARLTCLAGWDRKWNQRWTLLDAASVQCQAIMASSSFPWPVSTLSGINQHQPVSCSIQIQAFWAEAVGQLCMPWTFSTQESESQTV
jgi:hypothetical protein